MIEWYWLVAAFIVGAMFGGWIVFIEPLGDPEGIGKRPVFDGTNGNGYQPSNSMPPAPPTTEYIGRGNF